MAEAGAPGRPPDQGVRRDTEQRIVGMMRLIRVATAAFVFLPLLGWAHLPRPQLALLAALAAAAEAFWFARRTTRHGPLENRVALADAAFCVLLMVLGSRAVEPDQRNVVMTVLVPFSLGSAAALGLAGLPLLRGAAATGAMMAAWVICIYPDLRIKVASDLLGFALWYVLARRVAATWRHLAGATEDAQRATLEQQRINAEQRLRTELHHEVHGRMLPLVDYVALRSDLDPRLVEWARRTSARARRRLADPRSDLAGGLNGALMEAVEHFSDLGLLIEETVRVRSTPPPEVAAAVEAAVVEALNNVRAHAGPAARVVVLFAHGEEGGDAVSVVVRDRGAGFDPAAVARGGGLGATFPALEALGGAVRVDSAPGAGTKVTLRWPAEHPREDEDAPPGRTPVGGDDG
ncbi:ATP-binding protein [Kitasatospora sp. NPDC003701]